MIREVEETDVPSVIALVRGVLAEFGLELGVGAETDKQLFELPRSYAANGGRFWVADEGGIVGTCGVFPVADGDLELRKMYLDPDTRGRGVGKALLERAVAFARAEGARRLVLDTVEEMRAAIRFYEANGFVRDDEQRRGSRCTRGYCRVL